MLLAHGSRNATDFRPPRLLLVTIRVRMPWARTETISEAASSTGSPSPLRQHLFVVLSCNDPLDGGSRHCLEDLDEVCIGRGPIRAASRSVLDGTRRLVLQLPGPSLSSTHARLRRSGAGWLLEDCHSKNGTFVGGGRVDRATLRDRDILELGSTFLVYRDALPTPPGSPHDVDSREMATTSPGFATFLPAFAADLATLGRVASSNLPIVLLGETGVGKEVLAQSIHRLSGRSGPWVPVNCGAIPETLMESQLFGHIRGSFSGAVRDEPGLVRAAHGGTLFLDEIGDLPASSQTALLRVLQEGEVLPIGAARASRVDIRVVVATHRPLPDFVETGRFRRDLYARLNGFSYVVPPLRARGEDLPFLVSALLPRAAAGAKAATFSPAFVRALLRYEWPSNVRELQQALARAVVLADCKRLETAHLAPEIRRASEETPSVQPPPPPLEELSDVALRQELVAALTRHGGNVSHVARELGKARMQIQRWLKRLRIDPDVFRP
jgi:DNA-binding NtrC family response regulator